METASPRQETDKQREQNARKVDLMERITNDVTTAIDIMVEKVVEGLIKPQESDRCQEVAYSLRCRARSAALVCSASICNDVLSVINSIEEGEYIRETMGRMNKKE